MDLGVFSYCIDARKLTLPIDWESLFNREAELVVELGFGNGEFLVGLAKQDPSRNYIGFETSLTSIVKIQKKIHYEGLNNVRVFMVDGHFGLREFFEDNSVQEIYINFPCPWPKKAHAERRFTNQAFVTTVAAVLKKGGRFHLTSDVEWYVRDMASLMEESGCFGEISIFTNDRIVLGTRYERKWLSQGKVSYTLNAVKIYHRTVERWTWGETAVPHVHVKDVDRQKLLGLKEQVFKHERGVFVVKDIYASENEYLLRIVSSESNFQQRYFISVEKKPEGWLVKLDPDAFAYRTFVVKFSVRKVAEVIST
ncbi:MAG: tRNA (guanosine(46)-N7)-methyltransferase TrmB [Thermotoga caldifontis]|uniref:tRNA (guanosine(46)-N7)-methyltransferase TrmB n=1 Tax=Thermotoga caldifontis TaxID=1508419 RepID=UPI003C7C8E7A